MLDSHAQQLRLRSGALFSSFDRFTIPPLLVPIHQAFHVPLGTAALVASFYFIAYGVSQPFWGALADRFGRVPVIRASIVAGGICCVIAALAPTFLILLVARTFGGICCAALVPTVVTYVGDTVPVQKRQHALTLTIASSSAGAAIGTLSAGVSVQLLDWRLAFAVSAVLAIIVSIYVANLPEPHRIRSEHSFLRQAATAVRRPWVLVVLGIGMVEGVIILGSLTFISASLQDQGVSAAIAGSAAAGFGIANVCCVPVVIRAIKRFASPWLITAGGVLAAAGLLAAAVNPLVITALAAAMALGAGFGFFHPVMQLWATQVYPEARAVTVASFAGALFIGGAIASAGAAPLADAREFDTIFIASATCALALATGGAWLRARYLRSVHPPTPLAGEEVAAPL